MMIESFTYIVVLPYDNECWSNMITSINGIINWLMQMLPLPAGTLARTLATASHRLPPANRGQRSQLALKPKALNVFITTTS